MSTGPARAGHRQADTRVGIRNILRVPGFLLWFGWQMIRANYQVAADILTPGSALTAAVVAYPARARTSWEVMALSSLITLTPGTLSIEVTTEGSGDTERHTMYVLGLYAPPTAQEFRAELHDLESRMLRVMRRDRPTAASAANRNR